MTLEKPTLDSKIREIFADTFTMQNEGQVAPVLASDTVLLETGLDSLGFAILVTRLEEELGYDPFSLSADAYYPRTYQEFLDFYEENQPS